MNVLAAGVNNTTALLDIIDCSNHVAKGLKKDARYVASELEPLMLELDPEKTLFDLAAFDGASNVQKAGKILEVIFPRVTTIHGAEHVMSLFFDDIFKRGGLRILTKFSRDCRDKFGSTRHNTTAMFRNHSARYNSGRELLFVKPCETRMGGEIISLLRLLRLRDPLVSTTCSKEFKELKQWPEFCTILQNDDLWKFIFAICRATYAPMRILRLADMKVPGMGKLYYYVRQVRLFVFDYR